MKTPYPASDNVMNTAASAQRFRNQATGIGSTLAASERTGANRSRRVIDCAPVEQAKLAQGYPAPGPVIDPLTGKLVDKLTGKRWKSGDGSGVYPGC